MATAYEVVNRVRGAHAEVRRHQVRSAEPLARYAQSLGRRRVEVVAESRVVHPATLPPPHPLRR